jgi:hypothetical protein
MSEKCQWRTIGDCLNQITTMSDRLSMKTEVLPLLWRHKARVLMAFLGVAITAWLALWYADRDSDQDRKYFWMDCRVKGKDGDYHLGPCPPE